MHYTVKIFTHFQQQAVLSTRASHWHILFDNEPHPKNI